jgi:hypothetical protein
MKCFVLILVFCLGIEMKMKEEIVLNEESIQLVNEHDLDEKEQQRLQERRRQDISSRSQLPNKDVYFRQMQEKIQRGDFSVKVQRLQAKAIPIEQMKHLRETEIDLMNDMEVEMMKKRIEEQLLKEERLQDGMDNDYFNFEIEDSLLPLPPSSLLNTID